MKRIITLIVALIMVLTVAAPAFASGDADVEYDWAWAASVPDTNASTRGQIAMMEKMEELSGGRIKTTGYWNASMGSDRECVEGAQMGSWFGAFTGGSQMSTFVPDLAFIDTPFAFSSAEECEAVLNDPEFFAYLQGLFEKVGLHLFCACDSQFRVMTANKPIQSMEDIANLDIRVIDSEFPIEIWTKLGANPTPLAFTEVYTALQQGTVDAQENPLNLIWSYRFYEQQKYIILTNHQVQPGFFVCNADMYNSLPDDIKEIVDEILTTTKEAAEELEEEYISTFEDAGCTILEISDEAREEMREATSSVWDSIREAYPETFEAFTAALERVRASE